MFPSTEFNLWSGQTQVLPTDAYGVIRVYSGSRLIVPFAVVNVRELWLEPDAIVEFQSPNPRLVIGDRWINRGSLISTTAGSQIDIRVLGSEVILERPVTGVSLMAPNAKVTVTTMTNNSHFGILVGDVVEIQPDVRLWCDRSTSLSTSD